MWPSQLDFFPFIVCRIAYPPPFFVLLHFSHEPSNWSSPSLSSTTFQNFPGISELLSAVSKFQHHIQLWSKCSTVLVSSLNLRPVCWWKEPSCWIPLLPWKTILKIPIPYHARGTLEDPSMVQCGSTYLASLWTLPWNSASSENHKFTDHDGLTIRLVYSTW
jgi:hypothetical protein